MSVQLVGFGTVRHQLSAPSGALNDSLSILNNSTLRRRITHIGASFRPVGAISTLGLSGYSFRVVVGVAPKFQFQPFLGASGGLFGIVSVTEALAISAIAPTVPPALQVTQIFQRILYDKTLWVGAATATPNSIPGGLPFLDVDFAQTPDIFNVDEGESILMIATNPARSQGDTVAEAAFCEITLLGIEEGGASNVAARQ